MASFLFFALLSGGFLHGAPPGKSRPPVRMGNRLYFTPACPIIAQNFNTAADVNGATSDPSSVGWYLDASKVPNAVYFSIKSHRIKAQTLGGEGVWYSQVFNISGYTGIQVDAKISAEGTFSSSEYVKVSYILDGGPETLIGEYTGNFGTPLVTSAQMTGSKVQIVIRLYNVSAGNNDYYIEQYDVFKETGPCTVTSGIAVSASASNSAVLTCTNPSTTLSASTTASGTTTYSWTGPNSFTATGASVTATTAGTYTVTGTNSAGTGTASVTVTSNTTAPAGVTATASGSLSCSTTSVTLTGASTTSGTTFSWTGPSGFTATGATATATAAGTYTLTATNPTSGCTATASVAVTGNTTAPAGLAIAAANNVTQLTCSTNFTTLSGSSTTPGVTYSWSGPNNFTATSSAVNVFNAGTYTMTVTNPASGCTASASIAITQNVTPPAGVAITPSVAALTCSNPSAILTGSSTTTGVSYAWAGPSSFTATGTTATAVTPGQYILTVTDPTNGCTTSTAATVNANFAPPAGVTAINSGPITCSNLSVSLTGNSSTANVSYSWTGPNNYAASTAVATTTTAGTYTLTVTNPVNGCTAIATTVVAQDIAAPANVSVSSSTSSPVLNCINTSITLTASSSTPNVTYAWRTSATGSNVLGTSASLSVSQPNTYNVLVTNPANGCAFLGGLVVSQNITPPSGLLMTSNPTNAVLTCTTSSIAFNANASGSKVGYSWTGPSGFAFNGQTTNISVPGSYSVTATDSTNGCSSTASAVVTQNTTAPGGLTTTANPTTAQITCDHPTVLLTGNSTTAGVTYSWSGSGVVSATGATATVGTAGSYTVTVTDPTNGCVASLASSVTKNVSVPVGLTASPSDIISCFTPVIDLQGGSTTPGTTFSWSGPGGYTANTADAETGTPGSYTLVVTNPANGCTASTGTVVLADTATPAGVTASNNGPLNCINTSVTITSSSSTSGVDYTWVTPGNTFIAGATAVVTVPGTYTIQVTNNENGCVSQATTTVLQNTTGCSGSNAVTPGAGSSRSMEGFSGDTATGFAYKAYPNPMSTTAFIEFTSPVSSPVKVEIYSTSGYREQLLFSSTVNARQTYKLQVSGLSSGAHFCVINNNGKVYTTKLVVLK